MSAKYAVAPLLTQCVTASPNDAIDCPELCPGPNCVDTSQEVVDAAAANALAAQVIGLNSTVTRNRAERNAGDGFNVSSGTGNRLGSKTANANTGDEFDVAAGNIDLSGNKANGVSCLLPGVCL